MRVLSSCIPVKMYPVLMCKTLLVTCKQKKHTCQQITISVYNYFTIVLATGKNAIIVTPVGITSLNIINKYLV